MLKIPFKSISLVDFSNSYGIVLSFDCIIMIFPSSLQYLIRMRKLRLQTRYGNKRKVWKIEKKIYDQGPMNMFDKTYPWAIGMYNYLPGRMSYLSLSVHNGQIMVTETLQNQVARKKDKRTMFGHLQHNLHFITPCSVWIGIQENSSSHFICHFFFIVIL